MSGAPTPPGDGRARLPWMDVAEPAQDRPQAPRVVPRRRPLSPLGLFGLVALGLTAAAILIVLALGLPIEMIGGKLAVLAVLALVAFVGTIGATGAGRR